MFRTLISVAFFLAPSLGAIAQTVDVVGYPSFAVGTNNAAIGNSYAVTTSVHLTKAEFWVFFTGPQTLTFTVHASPVEFGTYNEVFRSSAVVNGVGMGGWYSSGAIDVPLNAGGHYIIAVSSNGAMSHLFGIAGSLPVSFGSVTHSYPVGTNPLPVQFSSLTDYAAIYHQRLTTVLLGQSISTFCTAGTTTNNCTAMIAGVGTPSATASSGFTISVSVVEGQKQGIIFYGVTGRAAAPWGSGGTSFLCVKAPTQRTGTLSSGGTAGACDGALSLDWNAWRSANSSVLGSPFSAGQVIDAQAWFRDPPAVKTTSLSNGLEFTLQP